MTLALLLTVAMLGAEETGKPKLDPAQLGIPYQRYTTTDTLGRTITFYLSTSSDDKSKLPIVLFIQGSGCQSLFHKVNDRIHGGIQNLVLALVKRRARVLVVEKPGVKFLDAPERPGSALGASEEFRQEHTLPRWTEANRAALRAAWTLPDIDRSRTLAIGHSEGGIIAARLAAEVSEITHVASLAGGGPNQLFSLAEFRCQAQPGDKPGDGTRRLQALYDEWAKVLEDPESTTKYWLGHPHRRWSTFLKSSVTEELLRTKARIFLAQGSLDTAVPPTGHDVLVAELRARNRDVMAVRVEGGDHGFSKQDDPKGSPNGLRNVFTQALEWFLKK